MYILTQVSSMPLITSSESRAFGKRKEHSENPIVRKRGVGPRRWQGHFQPHSTILAFAGFFNCTFCFIGKH